MLIFLEQVYCWFVGEYEDWAKCWINHSMGNFPRNNFPLLCFSIKMHTQRDICEKLFWKVQTPIKKKAAGGYCGIFSMFFRTPFYTTFSNQTFAHTICTFFFEISLICEALMLLSNFLKIIVSKFPGHFQKILSDLLKITFFKMSATIIEN